MSSGTTNYDLKKVVAGDTVSQSMLTEQPANMDTIDSELKKAEVHRTSAAAHNAEDIPYSGEVSGAAEVKQALDSLQTQVDVMVVGSGTSPAEVTAARAGIRGEANTTLKERLDNMESNIGKVTNISTDTTLTYNHRGTLLCDTNATNITLTLPDATITRVMKFVIIKTHADYALIIDGNGAQTIGNKNQILLTKLNDSIEILNDGSNWVVISNKTQNEGKINVVDYSANATIYDGVTSAVTAINLALADVPTNGTLYFPMIGDGIYLLDADVSLASYPNITIEFEPGAMFDIADTKIFTGEHTRIIANITRIFNLNTSGSITGTFIIDRVFPEWFGAETSDSYPIPVSYSDQSVYIQQALDFLVEMRGGELWLSGDYYIDSMVTINNNPAIGGVKIYSCSITITGNKYKARLLCGSNLGTDPALYVAVEGNPTVISNIGFTGNGPNRAVFAEQSNGFALLNLWFIGCHLEILQCTDFILDAITMESTSDNDCFLIDTSCAFYLNNCEVWQSAGTGFRFKNKFPVTGTDVNKASVISNCTAINISSIIIYGNESGFEINNCSNLQFVNCAVDGNNASTGPYNGVKIIDSEFIDVDINVNHVVYHGIMIDNSKYIKIKSNIQNLGDFSEFINHILQSNGIYITNGSDYIKINNTIIKDIVGNGIFCDATSPHVDVTNTTIHNFALFNNNTVGKTGIRFNAGGYIKLIGNDVVQDSESVNDYGYIFDGCAGHLIANTCSGLTLVSLFLSLAKESLFTSGNHKDLNVGYIDIGVNKSIADTAAPASGTWVQGDYCKNSTSTVGQPKGWLCTVGGTPGTWVSEGDL